jgi:uncharacterized protein YbjT (DUF2867 family)
MENWLGSKDRIAQGALAQPLSPETYLQMIAVDNIGAFVVAASEKPGHRTGRTLELAGDDLSLNDIAAPSTQSPDTKCAISRYLSKSSRREQVAK